MQHVLWLMGSWQLYGDVQDAVFIDTQPSLLKTVLGGFLPTVLNEHPLCKLSKCVARPLIASNVFKGVSVLLIRCQVHAVLEEKLPAVVCLMRSFKKLEVELTFYFMCSTLQGQGAPSELKLSSWDTSTLKHAHAVLGTAGRRHVWSLQAWS